MDDGPWFRERLKTTPPNMKHLGFNFFCLIVYCVFNSSCTHSGGEATLDREELKGMVLPLEAYGPDVQTFELSSDSGLKDNDTHLTEHTNPVDEARDITSFGRRIGYLMKFDAPVLRARVPEPGRISVASSVVVYGSENQARQALADEFDDLSGEWTALRSGNRAVISGDELSGREHRALLVAPNATMNGGLVITVQGFRSESAIGMIFIMRNDGHSDEEEAERLADILMRRVQAYQQGTHSQ